MIIAMEFFDLYVGQIRFMEGIAEATRATVCIFGGKKATIDSAEAEMD